MIFAGPLAPIENVLTEVLIWLHETGGLTWAWSIVALTVIVRILLVPVALRQIHSMQSLQIHAPEMKAIQQRYKNDRQRQSEELMKFYRENKINPYAACLPIVFQIPIFIGLFFVLRNFEDEIFCDPARGDFCNENREALPQFESMLEWLNLVNITADTQAGWGPVLLVVYVASQLTSTWLMSTQMQSTAQRVLIMVLPIIFIPFILSFPSGLMIYWLTTNLWTTGQGLITRRLMPRPAPVPKRTSRTPPKEAVAATAEAGGSSRGTSPSQPRSGPPRRVKRKRGGRPKR
jgi:YidC/Oxa1 family membrane protein insertase